VPLPAKGSACKRLNLFLRWMVRRDDVDPGGWDDIPPSKLVIPLDTHMHRICLAFGFTKRKQADMKTALEITDSFRAIVPDDPVRYDFALTRLGIRKDAAPASLLNKWEHIQSFNVIEGQTLL
ncbi:MAG: TIGR02757 family protein, partial [Deltaproteobacteria bacterium]|nr:TIGR02757 family protein [Deltaproteobacteria bacterium]